MLSVPVNTQFRHVLWFPTRATNAAAARRDAMSVIKTATFKVREARSALKNMEMLANMKMAAVTEARRNGTDASTITRMEAGANDTMQQVARAKATVAVLKMRAHRAIVDAAMIRATAAMLEANESIAAAIAAASVSKTADNIATHRMEVVASIRRAAADGTDAVTSTAAQKVLDTATARMTAATTTAAALKTAAATAAKKADIARAVMEIAMWWAMTHRVAAKTMEQKTSIFRTTAAAFKPP